MTLPTKAYDRGDGYLYYYITQKKTGNQILMACPLPINHQPEWGSELAVEDFTEPLSKKSISIIVKRLEV